MKDNQQTPYWLPCPHCNKMTEVKVYADTSLFNFPLYCQYCHKETRVDVFMLKIAKCK